ncbi:pyridoxine/pyridoxamine 5'-phosphate oxidase-like [Artemia franciscana]|uniref:pyridoxine/pyridoxamine 5'-phosphate oxidase-like n=1 Tax=Artemia franciscana TaxID=6661 RepID=UPI0032DBB392
MANFLKFLRPAIFSEKKIFLITKNMTSNVDIKDMRQPYKHKNEAFLEEHLVSREPFKQFESWFNEACKCETIIEPNAMCIATSTREGMPACRMVLLKEFGKNGFKFFTNYGSRKGSELVISVENPFAALMFYWEPLNRSIRIEGSVQKMSVEECTDYFHSRPKSSQIAACVSPQSEVIPSRQFLIDRELELLNKYAHDQVPKPEKWGGFIVAPTSFEFWQGQTTRMHDRIRFRLKKDEEICDNVLVHEGEDGWVYERLAP